MTIQTLQGHFLIAMPNLKGSHFSQTVTYICEHNPSGAMGIIINQAASISRKELFQQLTLNCVHEDDSPILLGGPVQQDRGFVLHTGEQRWKSTMAVSSNISVTGSKDILEDIASGKGPENSLIALGYAGWSANQLEQEIADNSWLTVPAEEHIIFNTPIEERWLSSAKNLGVNLHLLSTQVGHA